MGDSFKRQELWFSRIRPKTYMEESNQKGDLIFSKVGEDTALLQAVIDLGDKNRKWVGFFPREAFKRNAEEGRIIAALDGNYKLLGYILFYVARGRAVIQQLCVQEEHRKEKVGRRLVEQLKDVTKHLEGILLHCRRDFPSHGFWPAVGFVAVDEKLGRGRDVKELTRFWFDHGHPDLFSQRVYSSKAVAVIDANIFFDYFDDNGPEETIALKSDWLKEHIEFAITGELFNEINRQNNCDVRKRNRANARLFARISSDTEKILEVRENISELFPHATSDSSKSDVKHLEYAIAGNANFFLTRDDSILKQAEELDKKFEIKLMSPASFVLCIDELISEVDYKPDKLAGSEIKIRTIGAQDLPRIAKAFLSYKSGEAKAKFEGILRSTLAQTEIGTGLLIENTMGDILCFAVMKKTDESTIDVVLFRVKKCALAGTLSRNLAAIIIRKFGGQDSAYKAITVKDSHIDPIVDEALRDVGFMRKEKYRIKINLGRLGTANVFQERLKKERRIEQYVAKDLEGILDRVCTGKASIEEAARIEKILWPGRLLDAKIPTFIVPIRPQWAIDLFDQELAQQRLFPTYIPTALAWENAYYRSSKPKVIEAPSRILWYVSGGNRYSGSKCIRACSSLDRVIIGAAKDVYKNFKRFGIFEWKDIIRLAHGNPKGEIMAFIFSGTELLKSPIRLDRVRQILFNEMKTIPPLSTPVKIPERCFKEIYELGGF